MGLIKQFPKYLRKQTLLIASVTIATGWLLPFANTNANEDSTATSSKSTSHVVFGMRQALPVLSDGSRYTSDPYGEIANILTIAHAVKTRGKVVRTSTRGMHIPNKGKNRIVYKYEYTFPVTCGGNETFSFYEGKDFSALGYHYNGKVVMDVLTGGSPYSAPRLWGVYDQVLNDPSPMRVVAGSGDKDGFALVKASFMAGEVADIPQSKRQRYGDAYSLGLKLASTCISGDKPTSNSIMVKR